MSPNTRLAVGSAHYSPITTTTFFTITTATTTPIAITTTTAPLRYFKRHKTVKREGQTMEPENVTQHLLHQGDVGHQAVQGPPRQI